jgi:hypothetical protein
MQKSSTIWRLGSFLAALVLAAGLHAADTGDTAAKTAVFTEQKAKLDAAGTAYQRAAVEAYLAAYAQHMAFLESLNLADVSTQLPADPRASDTRRVESARALNNYFATLRSKLADWKERAAEPKLMEMYKKGLMGTDALPLDMQRSLQILPEFFTLYSELRIANPVAEAKPVDEPGVIDDSNRPKKRPGW